MKSLLENVYEILLVLILIVLSPVIGVYIYLVGRSEERDLEIRAADAGMTLDEYQVSINRMAIEQIDRINQEAGNADV